MVVLAALAGCTDTVAMTPANTLAQSQGSPKLDYFRGFPTGPMRVLMPNGENLTGFFKISEAGTIPAGNDPAGAPADGGGNFTATVHGPVTRLVCHANLVGGHGPGECRSQHGAVYSMVF